MKNVYLMREERESAIKNSFFFLHESYSAHLKIDVHCNSGAKSFRFSSTTA